MKIKVHFLLHLAQIFLEWQMFQTTVVQKIKTHILHSMTFFNGAVYKTMWKNIVQPGRPQMTIWCMRIACWIPKATNTLIICNTYFFPLQQWLHEHASMLHYAYIAYLVSSSLFLLRFLSVYVNVIIFETPKSVSLASEVSHQKMLSLFPNAGQVVWHYMIFTLRVQNL